ncbi:hypothetical protein DH2020_025435 [Rehmannia glutinosa]|uniref:Uncharacterized protein n=1 Tax=Rehmannia glutinosa TaxID=99300 RepID=A0ABR0VZQ3_REHGL
MRRCTEGRKKMKSATEGLAEAAGKRVDIEDRISQLADDILISIISRLSLREATTTSILSSRWRYLYAYSSRLDFPPFKPESSPPFRECAEEIQEKRFPNYINTVNYILDSHKGSRVKEFRVHMHCLEGANIERWIEFALARKVEIFDLQMHYLVGARRGHYSLGLSNLIRTNSGQLLPDLKCLRIMSLSAVHVNDAEVELLLSTSPLLESLSIELSDGLTNVLIVGHSLLLKHLGITYAANLQSIEICNMMNLVSLRCYGLPSTYVLRLSNVPKLIEFDTSDQRGNTLEQVLPRIPSCILDQLRLLKLSTQTIFIQYTSPTYMLPELVNLKHLELKVHMWRLTDNNDALFPLVEACPSLEELDIKFLWAYYSIEFEDREIYNFRPMKKLSPNLKKLKLSGYLGSPSELEFALFILKHVDALQELIVQPNSDMSKKIQRRAEVTHGCIFEGEFEN